MTTAIWFQSEDFTTAGATLMGRQSASEGFLRAFAMHGRNSRFVGVVRSQNDGREFINLMRQLRPDIPSSAISIGNVAPLRGVGRLYLPQPLSQSHIWQRHLNGPAAWSLCGVTHTVASARIMDLVTGWLTSPIQPWDAIICTSKAVHAALSHLIDGQREMLAKRHGAQHFPTIYLPIIPLGVDCDASSITASERRQARASLRLTDGDVVVMFLGRLSFHAKANPAPMYIALQRLAARRKVVLIECGWTSNAQIADALLRARKTLCPSVRSVVLDGRDPLQRRNAWAAADIFCSLSDNIQETFGLAPLEAMAAGVPCVVSDWNGYRETVRHEIDGFRISTLGPPPGMGRDLAMGHGAEYHSYDTYIGRAALAVAVDIDATTAALERLASDADLRRRMGANGAAQARSHFDWRVIIRAYEDLWDELQERRQAALARSDTETYDWPSRPDPFEMFSSYPTAAVGLDALVRLKPEAKLQEFENRLALETATGSWQIGLSLDAMRQVRDAIGERQLTVREYLSAADRLAPEDAFRALMLLVKMALAEVTAVTPLPAQPVS
jgi:glycosyltransferase involved in cell wall biosynthesis